MQIIIDENYVHLDDDANNFLVNLKDNYSKDEVEDWLTTWISSVIVPALMNTDTPELNKIN